MNIYLQMQIHSLRMKTGVDDLNHRVISRGFNGVR